MRNVKVAKVIGDGAYDSKKVYSLLDAKGIGTVVKPRKSSRADTRCPGRRRAVELVRSLGYGGWVSLMGYGRRWAVETAYSTFKRVFGENAMGSLNLKTVISL
jgi:hypothetical protein